MEIKFEKNEANGTVALSYDEKTWYTVHC